MGQLILRFPCQLLQVSCDHLVRLVLAPGSQINCSTSVEFIYPHSIFPCQLFPTLNCSRSIEFISSKFYWSLFLVNCFMSGLSPWPLALSCSTSVVHLPLVHFSTSVALRQLSSISPLVLVSSCVLLNVSWVHGPAWSSVLIFACTVCSSPLVLVLRVECAQSRPIG